MSTPAPAKRRYFRDISVENIRSGQPRPYADSYYEYVITFTVRQDDGKEPLPWRISELQATEIAKSVCYEQPVYGWHGEKTFGDPWLVSMVEEAPGVWRANFQRSYLD